MIRFCTLPNPGESKNLGSGCSSCTIRPMNNLFPLFLGSHVLLSRRAVRAVYVLSGNENFEPYEMERVQVAAADIFQSSQNHSNISLNRRGGDGSRRQNCHSLGLEITCFANETHQRLISAGAPGCIYFEEQQPDGDWLKVDNDLKGSVLSLVGPSICSKRCSIYRAGIVDALFMRF